MEIEIGISGLKKKIYIILQKLQLQNRSFHAVERIRNTQTWKQSRTKQVFFIAKLHKFVTFLLMLWSWLLKACDKLTRDSNKLVFKLCKSMQKGILLFILKQMLI